MIGNNCEEIFIVNSDDCVIGDNTTNIAIGCDTTYSNSYTLGNTGGYMNSINLATVTGATVLDGKLCHETVIGSNCDNIKVIGIGQSGNTFSDNITNVKSVTGFTCASNSVLVDGNAVTATTSYNGVVFDKKSADGNRWSINIDNSGVFSASTTTKLQ